MANICMLAFTHYASDPRVRREAEALSARGDKVDFICLKEQTSKVTGAYNGVRLYPLSIRRYRGKSTVFYLFKYFSFFFRAFFLLTFLFFKKRYDIIQVHTMPDFMVFAALVPKLLGAKIVIDVHDLMPELYISKFGVNEHHPLIKFIIWIEKRSIAFAHKAIAVHVPHREILVRHGNPKEKFSVLLNIPDPNIFAYNNNRNHDSDGKFRLVYHGTIAKRHGLEVAFRAMILVKKQIPNIEFSVIGDGDDCERLTTLVNEMGLNDCVKFSQGMVSLEELNSLISQAKIGIVPILYDSFTRYMLPVKLMEYVRLGIPVICSKTETIEAYFDDTMVRYFQSGDEVELARHVIDLFKNPDKREYLVKHADRFNKEYTWESQRAIYYNLVDSLLEERN